MEAKLVLTLLLLVATVVYIFAPLDISVVYTLDLLTCVAWFGSAIVFLAVYRFNRRRPVYLVEFACYKPGDERKISMAKWLDMTKATGFFNAEAMDFQAKIVKRSGLGDQTYLPPVHQRRLSMADGRAEATAVMFGCLDALFAATAINPRHDVHAVVVNSSLFTSTPSLTSMIVNHYRMREDVKVFNLSGMGCSAGLIAVDLAWRMLQVNPDCCAVVFSTENITLNWYLGNDRSMLLSNCIFRVGGAAGLLSNRRADATRAKYRLLHTVRTHTGAADKCFTSVYQREDDSGNVGVSLARELMTAAGNALKINITTLGPLILPLNEQLKYLKSMLLRRMLPGSGVRMYVPDFRRAVDHFCVHAGGRAVLEEMQRSLNLEDADMEASKCTLHRFGNTSSSSPWYELAYAEAKGRVRRGHIVWQIGLGAGFKCNSVVWRALRDVPVVTVAGDNQQNGCNPWLDSVDSYPETAYVASRR